MILEQHPSIGQRVTWTSNRVTKTGTIVAAMQKPGKNANYSWETMLNTLKDKFSKTHSIQFTQYGYRGAPVSFLVEVTNPEKPNNKPRLLHPYVHKLQPAEND